MPTAERTRTDFMALTISANRGRPETSRYGLRRKYTVTVQSDATARTIRFDYHGSVADYDRGITSLDNDQLLYAFWSFVSDAAAGQLTFAEFADDFGYDPDSHQARQLHKACRAALTKFNKLYHAPTNPNTILDRLSDIGIE